MSRERLVAGAAALVLAASIVWLIVARPGPITVPAPARPSGALAIAAVQAPAIGDFAQYDVNADNPFVPYDERVQPAAAPPVVEGWIPPHPEPVLPNPAAVPLHLPAVQPGGGDAPRVVGFVRGGEHAGALHVMLPGRSQIQRMQVGQRMGRWTLQQIESGSTAIFADESGRGYRLLIAGQ